MNMLFRRTLYLTFIFFFIVVGTLLLLYLQGYRYSITRGKVEQTGGIALTTEPMGATAVVNGHTAKQLTPTTVQSLAPGEYELTLTTPGYQSWHKKLTVHAAEVTFSGDVRLWPPPADGNHLAGTAFSTAALAPNRTNLLYHLNQGLDSGLWLLNLTSGQSALITRLAGSIVTDVEWAHSSREFLVTLQSGSQTKYHTYSLADSSWDELMLPADLNIRAVHWGDDEDYLYLTAGNELYRYTRKSHALKLLWRERLLDFRVHDELIFGLTYGSGEGLSLKAVNPSNLQQIPLELGAILSTSVVFLEARNGWLPLYDNDRHTLYLLHSPLTETNYVRRLPEVTAIDWSPEGEEILLTNNIEVWNYEISTDKLTLIRRVSAGFMQARRLPRDPYLLYASGNEVWALEFDTRAEQQSWLVGRFPAEISELYIDPKGQTLYAKTAIGLYKLPLTQPADRDEPPGGLPVKAIQKYLRQSTLP